MNTYRHLAVLAAIMGLLALAPQQTRAQADDFGLWYELSAEKKLSRLWSVGAEAEFRTRDNAKTADRWSLGLNAEFKIARWLKASAGYVFLRDNLPEELDLKSDGLTPNKWTPSYWSTRHRVNVQLTAAVDCRRWKFSLRERWQYTYRPSAEGKRFDIDEDAWTSVKGKGKNVLRSRLQIGYDIANFKADPYVSAEMFNAMGIQKMRYTVGIDYKLRKQHTIGLSYKYQNINDDDDDMARNSHIIGLSYKFKF